jgi:hypothetical protein
MIVPAAGRVPGSVQPPPTTRAATQLITEPQNDGAGRSLRRAVAAPAAGISNAAARTNPITVLLILCLPPQSLDNSPPLAFVGKKGHAYYGMLGPKGSPAAPGTATVHWRSRTFPRTLGRSDQHCRHRPFDPHLTSCLLQEIGCPAPPIAGQIAWIVRWPAAVLAKGCIYINFLIQPSVTDGSVAIVLPAPPQPYCESKA